MLGHLSIEKTFGSRDHAKSIQVRCLIVNDVSPYNIIIGSPSFNALEAVLSTIYLTLKYPLEEGRVGIVKGDQGIARKFYKYSLRLKKRSHVDKPIKDDKLKVDLVDIEPREELLENQLTYRKNVRNIQNGVQSSHTI